MTDLVDTHQNRALEMLRAAFNAETNQFNWDDNNFDWDKFNDLVHAIGQSRQQALELIESGSASNDLFKKLLAIKLAGDVMNPVEDENRQEARSIITILAKLSREESMPALLEAIAYSLGYAYMGEVKDALLALSYHKDARVRLAATISLGSLLVGDDRDARARLTQLSHDTDTDIADWANFHLEPIDEQ